MEVNSKPEKAVRKISDDFTAGGSMYETIDDFDIKDELLDDIGTISNVKAVQNVVDRLEHITYSKDSLGRQFDHEVDNLKVFVNESKQALV